MLTICLPVFNGAKTLSKTINSLLPLLTNDVKLLIVDDCSTDESREILRAYNNPFISVYLNDVNVGMDENFKKCVELSESGYVWLFGQDDYLHLDAGRLLVNYLQHSSVDFVSCDYDKFDVATGILQRKYIAARIQKRATVLKFQEFDNLEHYSRYFKLPPTFLPATIVDREVFLRGDHLQLLETNYVQLGRIIVNSDGKCCHFSKSIVRGDIPNDGWQTIASKRLNIAIGKLLALKYSTMKRSRTLQCRFFWREMLIFWFTIPKTLVDLDSEDYNVVESRLIRLGKPYLYFYRFLLWLGLGNKEKLIYKFYLFIREIK